MRSRSLCTMTNCRRSLLVVWALSLLLASPVFLTKSVYNIYYGNNDTLLSVGYCNDYDDHLGYIFTIYQLVVCFAVPAMVMIIAYSVVIRVLWKSNKNMSFLTNYTSPTSVVCRGNRSQQKQQKHCHTFKPLAKQGGIAHHNNVQKADDVRAARKQVIKMLICVVILFLLCWGPRFIMELLMKMQFSWLYYEHVYWTRVTLFLLPVIHAIFNPVVYFTMSHNFRSSLMKRFRCCRHIQEEELNEDNGGRSCAVSIRLRAVTSQKTSKSEVGEDLESKLKVINEEEQGIGIGESAIYPQETHDLSAEF